MEEGEVMDRCHHLHDHLKQLALHNSCSSPAFASNFTNLACHNTSNSHAASYESNGNSNTTNGVHPTSNNQEFSYADNSSICRPHMCSYSPALPDSCHDCQQHQQKLRRTSVPNSLPYYLSSRMNKQASQSSPAGKLKTRRLSVTNGHVVSPKKPICQKACCLNSAFHRFQRTAEQVDQSGGSFDYCCRPSTFTLSDQANNNLKAFQDSIHGHHHYHPCCLISCPSQETYFSFSTQHTIPVFTASVLSNHFARQ